jgi:hypothetical protein
MPTQLILTDEQAQILSRSFGPVKLVDANGKEVGQAQPTLTPEMIAELKRRAASPGPWFTSKQLQARLRALEEEWQRTGGFDEQHMRELLAKLNAEDPGHYRSAQ